MSRSRRRGGGRCADPTCRLQSSSMMLGHGAQAALGLVGYGVVEVRNVVLALLRDCAASWQLEAVMEGLCR